MFPINMADITRARSTLATSTSTTFNIEYIWNISQFNTKRSSFASLSSSSSKYPSIVSPIFSASGHDEIQLQLIACPLGISKTTKEHLSVAVKALFPEKVKGLVIQDEIALLDRSSTRKNIKGSRNNFQFSGKTLYHSKFVNVSELNSDVLLEDETLSLVYLANVSHHLVHNYRHEKLLSRDLSTFWKQENCQEKYCDVAFEIEGHYCIAHKAILSARSSKFADISDDYNSETREKSKSLLANVKDGDFSTFLQYLYTSELPSKEQINAPLLTLAKMFQVIDLEAVCESILSSDRYSAGPVEYNPPIFQVEHTWVLENYSNLHVASQLEWPRFISAVFTPLGHEEISFTLDLYPNYEDHISMYMTVYFGVNVKDVYLQSELSLIDRTGKKVFTKEMKHIATNSGSHWGHDHFIRLSEIFGPNSTLLTSDDTLKVHFSGTVCYTTRHFGNHIYKLAAHLNNLLKSGKQYDVTFVTECGQEFKAHRAILAARSPTFAAMFKRDPMNMGNSARYQKVEHILMPYSKEAFAQFLRYLYTGTLPSKGLFTEICSIANKYQVTALKDAIQSQLPNSPKVDTFLMLSNHSPQGETDCSTNDSGVGLSPKPALNTESGDLADFAPSESGARSRTMSNYSSDEEEPEMARSCSNNIYEDIEWDMSPNLCFIM